MTMRRTTEAERIENLKIEMENREESLERLVNKFQLTGYLTDDERELANEHVRWINSNKQTIKDFYKPAIIMA